MASKDEAIGSAMKEFKIERLKPEQKTVLNALLDGEDCVTVLPTGYGKSLPYQLFIPAYRHMNHTVIGGNSDEKRPVVLVCCPLIALMEDQVERLREIPSISAEFIGGDSDDTIKEGAADIIFASPEMIIGNPNWRSELQNHDVKVIVVDEFHTVITWGAVGQDEEKAFRKWFRHIGELRSLFPNAAMLALSATCTLEMINKVTDALNLTGCKNYISISPNKDNIKYIVKKVDKDIQSSMFWLIDALERYKDKFPRTLLYCNAIQEVSAIYAYVIEEVPDCKLFVEMCHSETTNDKKKYIISNLTKESNLKLVICTSALGMGIDVFKCYSVVLYGPPKSPVELLQQTGRVGRDGNKSASVLLYHSHQLQHTDDTVKAFLMESECRRLSIMKKFVKAKELDKIKKKQFKKHDCCDICEKECLCTQCATFTLPLEKLVELSNLELSDKSDSVSSDSKTISYIYQSGSDTDDALAELDLEGVHL